MSGSPLDPLVPVLTSLALSIGAAVLVTVSAVAFLRWLGLHWTWTLPGVLLGPLLWSFDQEAAGFAAATAVFATATGARWHQDDLRHGGDRAQTRATAAVRSIALALGWSAAACGAGAGSAARAWRSGATSAAAPSASRSGTPAAGTGSWSVPPARARRSRRPGSPAASSRPGTARS
jgi:hypothetical protein